MLFVKTWKPAKLLHVEKIVFTRGLGHGWRCGRIVAVSGFSVAGKSTASVFRGSLLGLCEGNARRAESRFGWGRETIAKGLRQRVSDPMGHLTRQSNNCGQKRSAEKNPQLAIDIRLIVEPHTHTEVEIIT